MNLEKIIFEVQSDVAHVRMNYPANLNAIDVGMAKELQFCLDKCWEPDIRVVVISGLQRCFSAGGDIGYFYKKIEEGEMGGAEFQELIDRVYQISKGIRKLEKPVIASCAGAVAGAGANLALSCDFLICADNVKFLQAFVNLGLIPDTGGIFLLARDIGWHRTLDLIMTGRTLEAEEGLRLGLIKKVVKPEALAEETLALAQKLAAGPAVSYANSKRILYETVFKFYDEYSRVESISQIECSLTQDFVEGVKAFVEKRKPQFQGR